MLLPNSFFFAIYYSSSHSMYIGSILSLYTIISHTGGIVYHNTTTFFRGIFGDCAQFSVRSGGAVPFFRARGDKSGSEIVLYMKKRFSRPQEGGAMTNDNAEKYVRQFHAMLYRLAFSYVRNCAEAEDICQDAFVQMLRCRTEFPADEDCKRWLIRVTINLSKNLLRSRRRRDEPLEDTCIPAKSAPEYELASMLRQLPPEQSAVIHLYYYEGYSVREIAAILKISVTSVTSRLSRGRKRLKALLEE